MANLTYVNKNKAILARFGNGEGSHKDMKEHVG